MPGKRGRLKPEDDYKVTKNYQYLKENFDPKDSALDYLISNHVFDMHDRDVILNGGEQTSYGRAERFISILQNAGADAYQQFIDGLRDSGYDFMADHLEDTAVPEENKKEPLSWIDELPDSVKTRNPGPGDFGRLSSALGHGWQGLFIELGLTQANVEQAQMQNPHSTSGAILKLFSQWKQKKASKAQVIVLLNALRSVNDRCTIDWEKVENTVKEQ